MRSLLLGGAVLMAALSGTALAADMQPVFKTLPPSAATGPYDWSGLYGGLNAGYSWGNVPFDYLIAGVPAASSTLSPNGPLGGAQLGYNVQSGSFVFGLETDFAWRHATDSSTLLAPGGPGSAGFQTQQGWIGTLRPRAGVAADNWLFYATGGLAFGSVKHSYTEDGAGAGRAVSDSDTRVGWTVGGGVEYAGGKRWSLGLEYLYADFGKASLSQPSQVIGGVPFPSSTATFHDQSHILRGKFNYRFDWGIPHN